MAPSTQTKKYAGMSMVERITLILKLIRLPLALTWALMRSPFTYHTRRLSWRRVIGDQALRTLTTSLSIPQLQKVMGTTPGNCATWTKETGIPLEITELEEEAKLYWMKSEIQTKKVVLYCHSGGFVISATPFAVSFLRFLQEHLKSQGKHVNVAILQYSLVPEKGFPTPLKQLILAVEHLVGAGIEPGDISLIGDSAGGNLILQLFSHLLHPNPSIPRLDLASPIHSAYLMSPWVSLLDRKDNMSKHDATDVISGAVVSYWGEAVLKDVPEDQLPYADPNSAPASWWDGVDKLVHRVLISVGGAECIRDEVVTFADTFKAHHRNSRFIVQQNGVHIDPMLDFLVKEKRPNELTSLIMEWFSDDI